jgi:hypothetical protein
MRRVDQPTVKLSLLVVSLWVRGVSLAGAGAIAVTGITSIPAQGPDGHRHAR